MENNNECINICKNCGNDHQGKFCNDCGQKSNIHAIDFHFILHEVQHSLFHVDGGLFYTIKELSKRPGNSIRDFIEGKRVRHFKPATFVIVLSIIYSFLEHKINKKTFIEDGLSGIMQALRDADSVNNDKFFIFEWLIHNYSYTALLLIPFFSLSSWIAFKKLNYNYFEHLTLNTFLFGQITFIFIISLPLSILFPNIYSIDIIRVILSIMFTFWAYFQFFNCTSKISRVLNTLLTYSLFVIISIIILFILGALIIF